MKIFLTQAIGRTLDTAHATCLMNTMTAGLPAKIYYHPVSGDALVSRARSIGAYAFLLSDADVMISVDSDIIFEPLDVMTICRKALEHGIVSAAYIKRTRTNPGLATWMYDRDVIRFGDGQPLAEVKWAATGFLATSRKVLEKMALRTDMHLLHADSPNPYYPFYMPMQYEDEEAGWIYLSEDYAFCERARQEGFTVWLDPTVRLGHIGTWVYRLEDMLQPPLEAQPMAVQRLGTGYESSGYEPGIDRATTPSLERSAA